MPHDVYFNQRCPVCGRMLEVRVALLGTRVYCQHCGGGFVALDDQLLPDGCSSAADRADELLERAAVVLGQPGDEGKVR